MKYTSVIVKNAERMMLSANITKQGLEIAFADSRNALIPFEDLDIRDASKEISAIDLPNPYEVVLRLKNGKSDEIPGDFARDYCDREFSRKTATAAAPARELLGERIRNARVKARLTQEELASRSGLGRVTLARIELGHQSPRFETLTCIAESLKLPLQHLLVKPL